MAASLAVAHHGVARHAAGAIAHGTAETPSFDHLHRTLARPRPISMDVITRHLPRTVRLFHRRDGFNCIGLVLELAVEQQYHVLALGRVGHRAGERRRSEFASLEP